MSNSTWVKMKDPKTGIDFYANNVTRQTQWDPPPGFVDATQRATAMITKTATSGLSANGSNNGTNSYYGSSSNPTNFSTQQSGFGSFRTTSSNINHMNETGRRSTTSSVVATTTSSTFANSYSNGNSNGHDNGSQFQSSTLTSEEDMPLPPNWERMYDKTSGKAFYVDHVNQITSWEHPSMKNKNNDTDSMIKKEAKEGMATGFGFIPKTALDRSSRSNNNNNNSSNGPNATRRNNNQTKWKYGSSNPPPTATSSFSSSSGIHTFPITPSITNSSSSHNDDMSTKYYTQNTSSSIQQLDFNVVKVPDRLRPACPSCDTIFSLSKRRHHCRVCEDVFCDACSSRRVMLPFDGEQYSKPVRVCDTCNIDVEAGNFYSMRRYLTPLQLFDGDEDDYDDYDYGGGGGGGSNANGGVTTTHVQAALSALSQDLEAVLLDSTSFSEKVTIPADILVPAISRYLQSDETSDRAIRALSTLLALGSVVSDHTFVTAVYTQPEAKSVFDDIFKLLEWSGSSTKTLAVQEQAARTLFYLTDAKVIAELIEMGEARTHGWGNILVERCDVHRALRSVLDHTTQNASPSLQRWSAACICNLVAEDYRRACDAINDAMTMGSNEFKYESFNMELVSAGGVMILSSLVSSHDSDTRSHAMTALSATIETTREMNIRLGVLKEAYGIQSIGENSACTDTAIIDAIVSAGACSPLTQLLLSADDTVATTGCSFAKSLLYPLLTNPLGSELPSYHRFLSVTPNSSPLSVGQEDGLGTYRNAAMQLASSDGILSALTHLVSDNNHGMGIRSMNLRRAGMDILAAITMTLSFWDSKIKAMGTSMESNADWGELKQQVDLALVSLEEEGICETLAAAFTSTSINSINTSRDSASSQLRESASLVICALAACSTDFASSLLSSNTVARLISTAADDGYATASTRGEWASRRLAMLEATAMIMVQGWKKIQTQLYGGQESNNSVPLELLLESLDAGIIPLISRLIDSRLDLNDQENVYGDIRLKISLCHIIGALFGIGQCDETNIGFSRIFEALGNTHYLIPSTVALLGSTITATQQISHASQEQLPISALLEANLLALGSMCGSRYCSFSSINLEGDKAVLQIDMLTPEEKDVFTCQFEEICVSTCDILTKSSFLASCLVGVSGEGSIMPMLRLISAIAENGPERSDQMLARSGALLPVADMLRDAMVAGDFYIFSTCLSLISICGPNLTSNSENSAIQSLRGCVQMFSNVLTIDEGDAMDTSQGNVLVSLKRKCIVAIERLSNNKGVWVTIVSHFIPCVSEYLVSESDNQNSDNINTLNAALRIILRVISLPSHAISISRTGLGSSLARLICQEHTQSENETPYRNENEALAIQVLHTLLSQMMSQAAAERSLVNDAMNVACFVLSKEAQSYGEILSDTASSVRFALEILQLIVANLENLEKESLSESPLVIDFVKVIARRDNFVKRLCATLLHLGGMREDADPIEPIYGPTLLLYEGSCGAFERSLDAAIYLLFKVAFYSSLVNSEDGEHFWEIFFADDQNIVNVKAKTTTTTGACAIFLSLLVDENDGMCVPLDKTKLDLFRQLSLPLVRERLLIGLHSGVEEFASFKHEETTVASFRHLLSSYNIPQSCLVLCQNPSMLDAAFQVLETILSEFSNVVVESVVSDRSPLSALFNLLSTSVGSEYMKTKPEKIRIFAAVTLSQAGKLGILGPSVKRHNLRSLAIASLSAACLMEEEDSAECVAEDLTGDGSSISSLYLRGLVDILSEFEEKEQSIVMSSSEAKAISSTLGKKLSDMILDNFMKRESSDFGGGEFDGDDSVNDLPEVKLLCALTTSPDSLSYLCNHGCLEALSLVAAEGVKSAILALHEACKINPEMVLTVEGHTSVMHFIKSRSGEECDEIKEACINLLATLCKKTRRGREAVSAHEDCDACIAFASSNIVRLSEAYKDTKSSEPSCDLLDSFIDSQSHALSKSIVISDGSKELSSIAFLSSIVHAKECRTTIVRNSDVIEAFGILIQAALPFIFKSTIISCLAALARYVKEFSSEYTSLSAEQLTKILLLISNKTLSTGARQPGPDTHSQLFGDFSETHHYNENLLYAMACTAFEHMLHHMSGDLVDEVLQNLLQKFKSAIDYQMNTTKKIAIKTRNSGLLACNISSILLRCSSVYDYQSFIKTRSVISDLLRVILLNPGEALNESRDTADEAKMRALEDERTYWYCAVGNCLQCLAILSIEPFEMSMDDIIVNVETEVQASKTTKRSNIAMRAKGINSPKVPSSSFSIAASLHNFARNGLDSTSSVSARRVIENLDLNEPNSL